MPWTHAPYGSEPIMTTAIQPPTPTIKAPAQSILVITMQHVLPSGMPIAINALLMNRAGRPQANKVLIPLPGWRTSASHSHRPKWARHDVCRARGGAGEHKVEVTFIGTEAYRSATATGAITIRPAKLTINTVPPLPGVGFSLDGVPFYTGADGLAQLNVTTPEPYPLTLLPLPEPTKQLPQKIEFERWADGVYFPERQVEMDGDQTFDIGFDLSYPVSQIFVDLTGTARQRRTHLFLDAEKQLRYVLREGRWPAALAAGRIWLPGEEWSGSNGDSIRHRERHGGRRQRCQHEPAALHGKWRRHLEHRLLLYSAGIRARDAIFGVPIGNGVT